VTRHWGLWRLCAFTALAGAIGAIGQAPYDLPILLLAAMAVAAYLFAQTETPKRAALIGFAFGLGYFAHALQWIVSPFMVDVARHGWMAPFAVVFLAAGMALFWCVAFWGARKLSLRHWPLILCWAAAELTRAYIFTGFPWASPAQSTVGVLAGQSLAWIGPHGLNTALIASAVALATAAPRGRALLAIPLAATLLFGPLRPDAPLTDHTIRLIQPNATQRDKWDPELVPVFFNRQLEYTAAGDTRPDLTIWPETAIPWPIDLAASAFKQIAAAAQNTPVILGAQRRADLRFYNSAIVLGAGGAITQTYDKHHLVPFGEYMPLGNLLARFGIYGLAAQNGNGYSAGPGAQLFDLGPLGTALPLICYEAVFAHDVNAAPQRPNFIIQVTNDGWFGRAAGPRQHLAQARMRAIEQGLPLARAANTGVSAMIDPYGRLTASLALNTAGYIDAALPKPLRATLYSKTGDWPLAVLLILSLICTTFMRPRGMRD
jgi:apolipoprotein N-acyltransferase